jgi:hypothetical protein
MSVEIVAALIVGGASIVAAVIGLSHRKSESRGGGNSFSAGRDIKGNTINQNGKSKSSESGGNSFSAGRDIEGNTINQNDDK